MIQQFFVQLELEIPVVQKLECCWSFRALCINELDLDQNNYLVLKVKV